MENSLKLFSRDTPHFSARSEIDQIYAESKARFYNRFGLATA